MNILFLSQIVPYPPHGGVLQRGYYLVKEISKDHRIDMIAFVHPDILPTGDQLSLAKAALLEHCKSVIFLPLPVKKSGSMLLLTALLSVLCMKPFSFNAYKSKRYRQQIETLSMNNNYDIVHFDTLALSQYLTCINNSIKSLTHHNVESELMLRRSRNEKNILKKIYYLMDSLKNEKAERLYIPQYDLNITCSEIDQDKLVNRSGAQNFVNIPNGVDTDYFFPKFEQQDENIIIHVGALQSSNLDGIQFFLSDIWPLIVQQRTNVRFILVGKYDHEALHSYIKDDTRIHLTGHVSDIRPYVHEASVFIVPLRIGGGTKLKVLDALSNGKAIVTTSIGAEGLEVIHEKHLLIADTPQAFASAVITLLDDRRLRISIGTAGRELVANQYDWSIVGKRLSTIYTEFGQRRFLECNT